MKMNKDVKKNASNRGFSLVEVLLAIVILGLVAAPILQIFVTSAQINLNARKTMAATDVANTTMEYLTSLRFEGEGGIEEIMTDTETSTRIPGISYIAAGESLATTYSSMDTFRGTAISSYGDNDGKKVIINNVSGTCLGVALRSVDYNNYKFDMTVEVYEPGTLTTAEDEDGDGENDVHEGVHFVDKLIAVNGAVANK